MGLQTVPYYFRVNFNTRAKWGTMIWLSYLFYLPVFVLSVQVELSKLFVLDSEFSWRINIQKIFRELIYYGKLWYAEIIWNLGVIGAFYLVYRNVVLLVLQMPVEAHLKWIWILFLLSIEEYGYKLTGLMGYCITELVSLNV